MIKDNIVLIGMPGCGKSTVGVILAKKTRRDFVDTDLLIQKATGRSLQDIVDRDGYMALRSIEEKTIVSFNCPHCVIATGGSAAYSRPAMEHLKVNGIVVFLDVDAATLLSRISDIATRGLAKRPDQSFDDLFRERYSLYTHYADFTIDSSRMTQESVCDTIIGTIDNDLLPIRRDARPCVSTGAN